MLQCEEGIKMKGIHTKYMNTKNHNIVKKIKYPPPQKKMWGWKRRLCDCFRTSEKARCGADLAETGLAAQLCMPLSCKTGVKIDPCAISPKKNDPGVENDPSFEFLGLLTMGSFTNPRHVYALITGKYLILQCLKSININGTETKSIYKYSALPLIRTCVSPDSAVLRTLDSALT